jgi:hypothetical protein
LVSTKEYREVGSVARVGSVGIAELVFAFL